MFWQYRLEGNLSWSHFLHHRSKSIRMSHPQEGVMGMFSCHMSQSWDARGVKGQARWQLSQLAGYTARIIEAKAGPGVTAQNEATGDSMK